MAIYSYEVLNPVTNNKKPYINNKGIFIFNITKRSYKYYIEAALNKENGNREYYFLLSDTKFDNNCRKLNIDSYGRCQIKVKGEMKDFITEEIEYRGNVNVNYLESKDEYDVYIVE